jgi:hypothetical protein
MLPKAEAAFFAIADIAGYTNFLAAVELDHAQDIIADFMDTVVKGLRPPFRLAKFEGDAAFVTPRSTTISIRSAISSLATFTSTDARPRWPSGALSPPNRRWGLGKLRNPQAACRYSDIAVGRAFRRQAKRHRLQLAAGNATPSRDCLT